VSASSFEPLAAVPGIHAAFIPRVEGIEVDTDRATALARLAPAHDDFLRARGFDPARLATAEQIHGSGVAVASAPGPHAGADALVTAERALALGIYVADCAAVFFADRGGRAIGLAHSGRAGTAANITGATIAALTREFGVDPADLVVHLSPCIRPPLYENDFAADIVAQARAAGAGEVIDDGICTGREVGRYYSYRVESGRTGRMLAVLALDS
jgi:copper oxidase (laccase) domain-containing protein